MFCVPIRRVEDVPTFYILDTPLHRVLQGALGCCAAKGQPILATFDHPLGLTLELVDPLPGNAQFIAELGQGGVLTVVEAISPYQYVPVALRKPLYGCLEPFCLHLAHHLSSRRLPTFWIAKIPRTTFLASAEHTSSILTRDFFVEYRDTATTFVGMKPDQRRPKGRLKP